MGIIFENVLSLGLSYFSFMFAIGIGIGFVTLGIITTCYGMGRNKKIGVITGMFGILVFIIILNVSRTPDNWIEIGVVSTIGVTIGCVSSCLLIFKVLSRIKNKNIDNENDDFEDVDLEEELKKLEREMNEGVEDDRDI